MLAALFWISLTLGLYPYVLYPVLVVAVGRIRARAVRRDESHSPFITVICAAFNEARHIEATVRNKLAQDWPRDRLEVLVVSDGSDDGTDAIVESIAREDSRVRLIRQEPRQGKTSGLNLAVPQARGDVIVFADANSLYKPNALRMLAANFADAEVGYVTGQMLYVNPDGSLVGDGCTAYMRYENLLRAAETRVGSIVGVDGGVDAIRRSLYRPMRADQLPDFVQPLSVVEQGYRVVYEPRAVLSEDTLTTQSSEFRMRIRVTLRAFWALKDKRGLFNPFRYPLFSWQLTSHKLLRYCSFLPLAIAFVLNLLLAGNSPFYAALAVGQIAAIALGLLALGPLPALQNIGLVRYCSYFLLLNIASAAAFWQFLRGRKIVIWRPRVG